MVTALQSQILETQQTIKTNQARIDQIRLEQQQVEAAGGERSRFAQREINVIGARSDELKTRLNILRTSRTSAEAAERERIFRRQVITAVRPRVVKVKPSIAEQRKSIAYRKAGFKPIIRNGKLVGLSDLRRFMDIPVGQIGLIERSRFNILDKGGALVGVKPITEATRKLERATRERGVIFLKRQELEKRGITKSEKRALTKEEKEIEKIIRRSEEILGIKDSGVGFISGRAAIPVTIGESFRKAITKRSSKLRELERKRDTTKNRQLKFSLKAEIGHIKATARKAELFGLGLASSTLSNLISLSKIPATAEEVYREVKKDPKNIIKIGKKIPSAIKEMGEQAIEFYRISPTEAIGFVAGEAIFFVAIGKGIGQGLKAAGKLSQPAVKAVRTALRGKKGTRMKILGLQGVQDDKIITKIIFTKGKRQVGGAIGTSVVKKGKVFTQTVGKIGKVGRIRKKFIQKGVFIGREVSIGRPQRFKIISQLNRIKKVRRLTNTERKLFTQLKSKKRTITITRDLEGLMQVGIGRIAQAPKTKLLRTAIRFPTGQLKKIKAKGLRIKDFVSISGVFTRKDWSIIIGKTLMKKKDIIEFIGLIKGTSPKTFLSFSPAKQKLFSRALKQVVGTASATTQKGRTIIPKLSPKARNLIATSAGVVIKKARVIAPKPIPIPRLRAITTKQKQISITRKKVAVKQRQLVKQREVIGKRQRFLARQAQTQATRQKQKQLVKQKVLTRQKQKILTRQRQKLLTKQKLLTRQRQKLLVKQIRVRVPVRPIVVPRIPRKRVPIVPIKRRRIRRIIKKKPKLKPAFNVFGKQGRKFIKLNKRPLSESDAFSRGAFGIDRSTSVTFKVVPTKKVKKLGKITKREKSYFARTKKKYRSFKIQKGKRVSLKRKRIEKRGRPRIDTIGEKRGLRLARFIKQQRLTNVPASLRKLPRKPIKKRVKRRKR